jgi:GNAT superfamily N-acetyltransferase
LVVPSKDGGAASNAATVTVRHATLADAEALAPLLGALGYPAEPAVVAIRLDALLGSARDAVLVAEGEGGALLGVLALHWGTLLHLATPIARIGSLVVAEAARGRGVGALLIQEAAAVAKAEGCAALELTTNMRRHAAHAFYAARGFTWTSLGFGRKLDGDEPR